MVQLLFLSLYLSFLCLLHVFSYFQDQRGHGEHNPENQFVVIGLSHPSIPPSPSPRCSFCFSILRKPASWLVAVCERSENRGCGGGWLPKGNEISPCPCVEREKTEHFAGLCTTRQFADGGVSIPPRSAFLVAGETMRMHWKIQ